MTRTREYTDNEIVQAVRKERGYRDYVTAEMLEELLDVRKQLRAADAPPRPVKVGDWVVNREAVTPQYVTESGQVLQVNGNPEWYKRVVYVEVATGESEAASRFKIGERVQVVSENGSIKAGHSVGTIGVVKAVEDEDSSICVDTPDRGYRWHSPGDLAHASTLHSRSSIHDVMVEDKPEEEQQIVSFVGARHAQPWPTKSDIPEDGKPRRYTRRMGASGLDERTVEDIVPTPEETIEEAVKRRTRHLERRIQSQRAELRRRQSEADQLNLLRGLVHTTNDVETLRLMALRGLGETSK